MKVVMVKYFFDTEANYQITEMAKAWPKEHELVIITSKYLDYVHKFYDESQELRDRVFEVKYGVTIVRLDCWFRLGSRVFFKGLKLTVDSFSPDVLFMHGIGDFNDVLYLYGRNKYLTFRDCHMSWIASKNRFAKLYYKFYSIFFAPIINKFHKYELVYALGLEEKEYIKAIGINDERIAMLPHGYNKNAYYPSTELRKSFRERLGIADDELLVIYTGKFDYAKLPDVSLDIYESLGGDFIEENKLKFVFIGSANNTYFDEVFMNKLNRLEFKNRVTILPAVSADELVKVYNGADLCLWPRETTLSSIHAQVCGRPVIMENHISNLERVVDRSFLFKKGSLDDAITKLISAIESVKQGRTVSISELDDREYNRQVKKMLDSWQYMIAQRLSIK